MTESLLQVRITPGAFSEWCAKQTNLTAANEIHLAPPSRSFRSARKVSNQEEGEDIVRTKENNGPTSRLAEEGEERFAERRFPRPEIVSTRNSNRTERGGPHVSKPRRKEEDENHDEVDREQNRFSWRARENRRDQEEESTESRKFDRQLDWRRNRDWNQQERVEAEPEWMDATEAEDPIQVHTQEDFQRWKERMKAGGAAQPDKIENQKSPPPVPAQEKPAPKTITNLGVKSPDLEDAMDKFFARFNQQPTDTASQPTGIVPAKKARFAALWNAPVQQAPAPAPTFPEAQEIPQVSMQFPSTTDADQAGFARILQMLGSRNANATLQENTGLQMKSPLPTQIELGASDQIKSPEMPQNDEQPRIRTSKNLDRYLKTKSPDEQPPAAQDANKDPTGILLKLMRQANLNQEAQQTQPEMKERHHPPSLFPALEDRNRGAANLNNAAYAHMLPPHMGQRDNQSIEHFDPMLPKYQGFEESMLSKQQRSDDPRMAEFEQNGLRSRPTNGSQPNFFDDGYVSRNDAPRSTANPQNSSVLPGIARPPGFDNIMPRANPNWPNPPSQQQPRPMAPPGISSGPRGMPAPFGPSMLPPPPNLQQQQQQRYGQLPLPPNPDAQRPPQRKYTGDSAGPGPPGFPGAGMPPPPPPGFIGNGPPPGFPGAPPRGYARFPGGQQGGMGRGAGSGPGAGMFAELYSGTGAMSGSDSRMRAQGQMGAGYR